MLSAFHSDATFQFNARGVVAMANSGPDTNKSQFFITYSKQAHLDGKYTIFGKVIDGADAALDEIERVPVNNKNRPLSEIKLINVSLISLPASHPALMRLFSFRLPFTRTLSPTANYRDELPRNSFTAAMKTKKNTFSLFVQVTA